MFLSGELPEIYGITAAERDQVPCGVGNYCNFRITVVALRYFILGHLQGFSIDVSLGALITVENNQNYGLFKLLDYSN